jgi:phenylalanyl-tRNA synthetase beta chain
MKILYSWLKDFIQIRESPEKLAELLSWSSFETIVEKKIGRDAIFEVSILPNRVGDASSHFGIAREIALLKGKELEFKIRPPKTNNININNVYSIDVSSKDLVRRYMIGAINNVKVKESPQWLKKRLLACGIRPINNIVDATNYVMLELGQPLHAFDANKISGKKILVRTGKSEETLETIDRKTYELSKHDILICDQEGPLAIAGIKGGRRAEISSDTKNIIIESASFDPIAVRETSKRLNLRTDASWRFENGTDPENAQFGLYRVLEIIKEVAGGEILRGVLDFYPEKALPWPIKIDVKRISKIIGEDIDDRRVIRIIKPFCEKITKLSNNDIIVKVKTFRRDIRYFEDIVEEVARILGYNNIKYIPPTALIVPHKRNESFEFRERIKDELVSLGFQEVYNYSFIGEKDLDIFKIDIRNLVELENPVSTESKYLRPSLFPNIMKNIAYNLKFFSEIRIFEVGKCYEKLEDGSFREIWHTSGALARKDSNINELFFETKGIIETLMERFGFDVDDYRFSEINMDWMIPGSGACLYIGANLVGILGGVREDIRVAKDIESPVVYFDMFVEELERLIEEEHEFEPLHKYPDVIRDISILVEKYTRVEEIENIIEGAGAKYLEDVELFDVYEGENLPEDKTSMAFHLIFRAPDRTLTDEEVNAEFKKISDALKEFGAEIR